jgi:hypothetical protein
MAEPSALIGLHIEAFLRSHINCMQGDWEEWLDLAEFAINNSVHKAHGMTPFFIIFIIS